MDGIDRGPYGAQYLVSIPPDSMETAYQMDIMMQARPDCLLPVHRQATARGCRYAYPVTGLDSLDDRVAAGAINQDQAIRLIRQLVHDLDGLQDQLLLREQVRLRPEALFLDADARHLQLVYQPFQPLEHAGTIDELVEWLGGRLNRNRRQKRRWETLIAEALPDRVATVPDRAANARSQAVPEWMRAEPGQAPVDQAIEPKQPRPVLIAGLLATMAAGAITFALNRFAKIDWRMTLLALLVLSVPIQLAATRQKRRQRQADAPAMPDGMQNRPSPVQPVPAQLEAVHLEPVQHELEAARDIGAQAWLSRIDPKPLFKKASALFQRKIGESPASQERMHDMPTQLLSSRQELFRLATLSEGMIGSNAETAGQRAFILNDEFLVGRDFRTVDLCLTGYAVGRQHARITRQGAAFLITDLGSKNGTRLNGERLNKLQSYVLPDRCQLQFADRLFYFEAEELPVGA